ncbi:MAG: hypothetical protein IJS19_05175 [Muribaculaceae bacterium]|nr:hypothetical protein [Muribaculaceae bacterium]
MGAIIGILSRLFSGGGLIVLALLGLLLGVLGDFLLAVLYIYGTIGGILIVSEFIIPVGITVSAVIIEYIVYPFRWLNNYLLGEEKPEFDFLKIKTWPHLSPIDYVKRQIRKKTR